MTMALEGGEGSVSPWPHFTPGKDLVPIVQEAGWAPGLFWTETWSVLAIILLDCAYWLSEL